MRKIITTTFVTMDGVMQAPGGREEDASGAFPFGGWQANVVDRSLNDALDRMHVWTHPVTIGVGKRLFADGTGPATWKLVKGRVGVAGVIFATYEPAGELATGTTGA